MFLTYWLRSLNRRVRKTKAVCVKPRYLRVEPLEIRKLLSSQTIDMFFKNR